MNDFAVVLTHEVDAQKNQHFVPSEQKHSPFPKLALLIAQKQQLGKYEVGS